MESQQKGQCDMTKAEEQLTLKEKWERLKKEKQAARVARIRALTHPANLNKVAPVVYVVTLLGILTWGAHQALPVLYPPDTRPGLLFLSRLVAAVLATQIITHWLFLKLVKSAYLAHPDQQPAQNEVGQEVQEGVKLSKQKDGRFLMYVATGMPDSSGRVPRKAFPYWSWTPCLLCQKLRPPRCHHCTLCGVCVLKRDHHCYFAGNCVGVHNMRYYVTFLSWGFLGTCFASLHMWPYFYYELYPKIRIVDMFPPFAFIRALLGYQDFIYSWLGLIGWTCTLFVYMSAYMLVDAWSCVLGAQTSFECENRIKVADSRTRAQRIRAVFGPYWLLNFLFPLHFLIREEEDPIKWPTVKLL